MPDRLLIYETATGKTVTEPPALAYSWTAALNDNEGSITLQTTTAALRLGNCVPWGHSLAVISDAGRVLAAGPIYSRDIDNGAGTLELKAGSLMTIFKRRIVFNYASPPVPPSTGGAYRRIKTDGSVTTYQKTYKSTLAGIVLALAKDRGGDLPGLPAVVVPGGTHTRTYDGLELQTVADRMRDLFQTENPPTIAWEATLDGNIVKWTPRQVTANTRQTIKFNADAVSGPIAEWTITEDAGNETFRSWQVSQIASQKKDDKGKAEAASSMFARRDNNAYTTAKPPGIVLESVNSSHDNITNGATLAAYAKTEAAGIPYFAIKAKFTRAAPNRQGVPVDIIRPGDVVEISTRRGFYGPSIFAGIVTELSGDEAENFAATIEKVTRRNP